MGWDKFGFLFVCSFLHNVTVVVGDKFEAIFQNVCFRVRKVNTQCGILDYNNLYFILLI